MSRTITLAIAGPADIHPDNAAELLDDHLDGVKNVSVIVPVTEDHLSEGLQTVLDYLDDQEIPWTAVTSADEPRRIQRTLKTAEFIETVDEPDDIEQHIVDMLSTAREDGHETATILLWGEDEEDPGQARTQLLLELAYDQGITCLDLSAGLDSFSFVDDDEPAPEPEPEPEPARKRRSRKAEPEELTETEEELTEEMVAKPSVKEIQTALSQAQTTVPKSVTTEPAPAPERRPFPKSPREWKAAAERPDEAQALIPPQLSQAASEPENAGQDEEDDVPLDRLRETLASPAVEELETPPGSLKDVLSAVYEHLRLVDEANAAVNLAPVRYRPLTKHVHAYLRSMEIQETSRLQAAADADLVKTFTEPTPKPAEKETPKRGRARTDEGEMVAVLRLEDGTYKKRGRGRPPAGSTLVDIPVEEAQELGLVA